MAEKTSTAPPLTVDTVLTAVQGVNWRTLGERLLPSEYNLESGRLIYPKVDKIERLHQSDGDRLRAVVECWMQGEGKHEEPSWRRIIWELDWANETRTAENIRIFAEPVQDPTLTVEKVTEVMGEVGDRERVWGLLGVPASKQAEITQQSSTEGEKSRALSQYWVNCYPDASWERLASALYFRGEERAAVMAGQYLPMKADPTLTTDNLMEVVKEVEHRWEELGSRLVMPGSKLENIKGLYQTDHLRMEAVVDYYMKYNPTSSWKEVGTKLQKMGLHQLANNITTNYVRGPTSSSQTSP